MDDIRNYDSTRVRINIGYTFVVLLLNYIFTCFQLKILKGAKEKLFVKNFFLMNV